MMHAISMGASDTRSIRMWTGLPESCIKARITLLDQFNIITASHGGLLSITPLGKRVIAKCRMFS